MTTNASEITFSVPDMSCGHCRAAILAELERVAGVSGVDVDLDAKLVRVRGEAVDPAAVREAIDEAGYSAVP